MLLRNLVTYRRHFNEVSKSIHGHYELDLLYLELDEVQNEYDESL